MGDNLDRKELVGKISDKAAKEVKFLILEELASLQPFPLMEVGINVDSDYRCNSVKNIPGIILRDSIGPANTPIKSADYIVLKPDGAYSSTGGCFKKDSYVGWWNFFEEFLPRENSISTPLNNADYIKNYQEIFEAIEQAKETCKV